MEENNFANATYKDGFAGDRRYLKGFLAKMNLIFMIHPDRFNNDETKVIYVISRLYGNAMNWAASLMENQDPCLLNYEAFVERMKSVYGSYDSTFIANQKLRTIRQKRLGDIRSYILEFNSYADESSWNEEAKMDAFLVGLNDQIATRILEMFPGPRSLTAMQTIASRIDGRLSAHRQFTNNQNRSNNNLNNNNSNKKRWNFYKKGSNSKHYGPLSDEEKERRKRENLCLYCGSSNHTLGNCPLKNKKKSPSSTSHITNPEPKAKERTRISDQQNLSLPIFEFTLNVLKSSVKTKILLDSGSQLNLMDVYFANENNIPYSSETIHPEVGGIGGTQKILGETLPISIRYKNHNCKTKFYVVDLPSYCALLGAEWLSTHNPTIDFSSKTLHFNSKYCINNCLVIPNTYTTFIPSCNLINEIPKNSDNSDNQKIEEINNSEEKISNEIINNTKNQHKEPNEDNKNVIYLLPTKLSSFMDVFSEIAANMLHPHRQYDCEINLKPNTNLYYGPIYPFHHQINGLTERVNSVIEQYLRCYTNFKGSNWNDFLYLAEFSYNNTIQESTNHSPFFANYGFNPRHSPEVPTNVEVPRAEELVKNLAELTKELKENIKIAIEKQEKYANKHRMEPPEFKKNDKVWINSSLIIKNGNKKLKPRKLGPFKILSKISPVSYKLDLPKNLRIHPIMHVSDLEPYFEDKFGRNQEPPPIIINNEEEYEVEQILDKRTHYGKIQYLIKWKGYPLSEASWEPEENLNCPKLLKKFNKNN